MVVLAFFTVALLAAAVVFYQHPRYIRPAIFGLLGILVLTAFFWRESLVLLSVTTIVGLGLAVASGHISGREASMRASVACLLFLSGTWIAIDVASGLFGGSGSTIFANLKNIGGIFMGETNLGLNASLPARTLGLPAEELMAAGSVVLMLFGGLLPRSTFSLLVLGAGAFFFLLFGLPVFIDWVDGTAGFTGSNSLRPALIVGVAIIFVGIFVKLYKRG